MSRNTPHFSRPSQGRSNRSRLDDKWKKPRGTGNKKRKKFKQTGAIPSTGYSRDRVDRFKHPCGLREVIVYTVNDLQGLKDVAVRISSNVGLRKRIEIEKNAKKLNLKLLVNKSEVHVKKLENDKKVATKRNSERQAKAKKKDKKIEKPEPKTETKTEKKIDTAETKADVKTEAKTEMKTETKTEAKPETKTEAKTETKPEKKESNIKEVKKE